MGNIEICKDYLGFFAIYEDFFFLGKLPHRLFSNIFNFFSDVFAHGDFDQILSSKWTLTNLHIFHSTICCYCKLLYCFALIFDEILFNQECRKTSQPISTHLCMRTIAIKNPHMKSTFTIFLFRIRIFLRRINYQDSISPDSKFPVADILGKLW